jgi:hypothetical protein
MPPQKPSKKRLRNTGIGCGILAAIVVLVIIIAAAANGSKDQTSSSTTATTPSTQVTTQPTNQPTAQPTDQPTIQPTSQPKIGNQVVVGGTEDSFTAQYGDPTPMTTANGTHYLQYDTGNSNIGQFDVILIPNTTIIFGIAISAPTGQPWDSATALEVCVNYLPGDAKLDQPQNVTNSAGNIVGLLQSGFSAELANTLPAGVFLDANNNQAKAGTFSTIYSYADGTGTTVNLCTIRLGLQSTKSSS